jgi:hypothetical protein
VKYWAFISYSHIDTAVADWLHKKIETYRVPRSLVGTPSREGNVPHRLIPIFRDREELPTSSELGDNLQRSLQQSRHLIVICSPAAAQSRWVEEEVRAFKGWNGRDRIIALVASGIPNASDRGDPAAECFPHSLRFDVGPAASPIRVEPIAADIRPEGDGRQRAFLKIVAGLLGVGFDDLYQREKRREKRRKVLVAAIVVIGLLAVAGVYASIAHLGESQKELRTELNKVGTGGKVTTTQFKDLRPANKEAESRIRAAAERANAALDQVEQSRIANKPDEELTRALQNAQTAVLAVTGETTTLEEQLFAAELAKPLTNKLLKTVHAVSEETQKRAQEKARLGAERIRREVEKRSRKNP